MQKTSAGTRLFIWSLLFMDRVVLCVHKVPALFVLFLTISYSAGQLLTREVLTGICLLSNTSIATLKAIQTDIRLSQLKPQSHSYLLLIASVAVRLSCEPFHLCCTIVLRSGLVCHV